MSAHARPPRIPVIALLAAVLLAPSLAVPGAAFAGGVTVLDPSTSPAAPGPGGSADVDAWIASQHDTLRRRQAAEHLAAAVQAAARVEATLPPPSPEPRLRGVELDATDLLLLRELRDALRERDAARTGLARLLEALWTADREGILPIRVPE